MLGGGRKIDRKREEKRKERRERTHRHRRNPELRLSHFIDETFSELAHRCWSEGGGGEAERDLFGECEALRPPVLSPSPSPSPSPSSSFSSAAAAFLFAFASPLPLPPYPAGGGPCSHGWRRDSAAVARRSGSYSSIGIKKSERAAA